jgi:hypothetical protein
VTCSQQEEGSGRERKKILGLGLGSIWLVISATKARHHEHSHMQFLALKVHSISSHAVHVLPSEPAEIHASPDYERHRNGAPGLLLRRDLGATKANMILKIVGLGSSKPNHGFHCLGRTTLWSMESLFFDVTNGFILDVVDSVGMLLDRGQIIPENLEWSLAFCRYKKHENRVTVAIPCSFPVYRRHPDNPNSTNRPNFVNRLFLNGKRAESSCIRASKTSFL